MRISLNNSVGFEMSRGFQLFNFCFILFPFLEAGGQRVELKRPYVRNEPCIFDEMKLVKGKEVQEKKTTYRHEPPSVVPSDSGDGGLVVVYRIRSLIVIIINKID